MKNLNSRPGITQFIAFLLLCAVGGCTPTTQLGTSWRDPAASPLAFKKVVVVVLNSTPGERRAQEDALVGQIKKATAVPSYTLVPDDELANRDKAKDRIIRAGFDGLVVLRLLASREESYYVPGSTNYWTDREGYVPYSSGYQVTDTIIRAEVSLYTVPEGKLLWVGTSTTSNPANARDFAVQVASAAAVELRNQGLLQ